MDPRPSIGRIVHYFPADNDKDAICHKNGNVEHVAATVTKVHDAEAGLVNLSISPDNNLPVPRLSIQHKSAPTLEEGVAFWDWPAKV